MRRLILVLLFGLFFVLSCFTHELMHVLSLAALGIESKIILTYYGLITSPIPIGGDQLLLLLEYRELIAMLGGVGSFLILIIPTIKINPRLSAIAYLDLCYGLCEPAINTLYFLGLMTSLNILGFLFLIMTSTLFLTILTITIFEEVDD